MPNDHSFKNDAADQPVECEAPQGDEGCILALAGRIAPGWLIKRPLFIRIERDEDGSYLASDDQFAVYGEGDNAAHAVEDYVSSLIDYYQLLAARTECDQPTASLFGWLRIHLIEEADE
jgi:hypothetical protein